MDSWRRSAGCRSCRLLLFGHRGRVPAAAADTSPWCRARADLCKNVTNLHKYRTEDRSEGEPGDDQRWTGDRCGPTDPRGEPPARRTRSHPAGVGAALRHPGRAAQRGWAPALLGRGPAAGQADARRDRPRATRGRGRPRGSCRAGCDRSGPRPGRCPAGRRPSRWSRARCCRPGPRGRRARAADRDGRGAAAGHAPGRAVVGDRSLRRRAGTPHQRGRARLAEPPRCVRAAARPRQPRGAGVWSARPAHPGPRGAGGPARVRRVVLPCPRRTDARRHLGHGGASHLGSRSGGRVAPLGRPTTGRRGDPGSRRLGTQVFYAGNAFLFSRARERVPGTYLGESLAAAAEVLSVIPSPDRRSRRALSLPR